MMSPPQVGAFPITMAVVADMGAECTQKECANPTIVALAKAAEAGAFHTILHSGDIAYADGTQGVWDDYMNQIEPIVSRVPYMVAVGNHERHYNFSAFRHRFNMPNFANTESLWWSHDFGPVHVVAFSTEHQLNGTAGHFPGKTPSGTQLDFLNADLAKANANRANVPWIVMLAHKPIYCSTRDYFDCMIGGRDRIGPIVEPLLKKHKVDLMIAGHLHNYERTYPVTDNGTTVSKSYINPVATVHSVAGNAGCDEQLTHTFDPKPEWCAIQVAELGYVQLDFLSASHMKWQMIGSKDGSVLDSFEIVRTAEEIVV